MGHPWLASHGWEDASGLGPWIQALAFGVSVLSGCLVYGPSLLCGRSPWGVAWGRARAPLAGSILGPRSPRSGATPAVIAIP